MKSETLAVSDLCGIHVGKSMEILLPGFQSSGAAGILLGMTKDDGGYNLNLGGFHLVYGHDEALSTRIRLYQ